MMIDASFSAYVQNLDETAKLRYLELKLCGGVDLLLLRTDELRFDVDLVPRVEISDIKDYLVHATSYITHEEMKGKRSLEAHNYLTSGFVQEPLFKVDDVVIVPGKVRACWWFISFDDPRAIASLCANADVRFTSTERRHDTRLKAKQAS